MEGARDRGKGRGRGTRVNDAYSAVHYVGVMGCLGG